MKCFRVLLFSMAPILPAGPAAAGAEETPSAGTLHTDGRGTPELFFPSPTGTPVVAGRQAADDFLKTNREKFKLAADATNLELVSSRESLLGMHYRYRQMLNGVPVVGADVVVSIGRSGGEIYLVYNNSYPVESAPTLPKILIGAEGALDAAWNHLRVHGGLLDNPRAELVYIPVAVGFRLVYRTLVPVRAPFGYWEHQIDAGSGEVVAFRDTTVSEHNEEDKPPDSSAYTGSVWPRAQTTQKWAAARVLQKSKTTNEDQVPQTDPIRLPRKTSCPETKAPPDENQSKSPCCADSAPKR